MSKTEAINLSKATEAGTRKEKTGFSILIEKEVLDNFKAEIEKKNLNQSKVVQELIEQWTKFVSNS